MCKTINFSDSVKNKDDEVIISSHPYVVDGDTIIVARTEEDTSDLPKNLFRVRSQKI